MPSARNTKEYMPAEAIPKLKLLPLMGLAEVSDDNLPWLQLTIRNKKGEVASNLVARLTSLAITPDRHNILYLECVAHSGEAKEIIDAAADYSELQAWGFLPTRDSGFVIHPQNNMRVSDVLLENGLHFVAMLSQEEDFIIAENHEQLWQKLRRRMSCPTQAEWGGDMLPLVFKTDMLLRCETFGLPEGMEVYILQSDSEITFDELAGKMAWQKGLHHAGG